MGANLTLRKYVPLIITAACALIMTLGLYIDVSSTGMPVAQKGLDSIIVKALTDNLNELGNIITLTAVFVAIAVQSLNYRSIASRAKSIKDKFLQYEMLGVMVLTIVLGMAFGSGSQTFSRFYEYTMQAGMIGTATSSYWQLYAGYRALRVRTLEGAGLFIAAVIVMVGMAPWGYFYINPMTRDARQWMLDIVSKPVFRAIVIGGGIGSMASAFRTIIGREQVYARRE